MTTDTHAAAGTNGVPAAPPPPPDVFTPAEAAAYLRVPESVLLAEAGAGRLPGRKVGTEWRFLARSLAGWLAAPQPPAPPPIPDPGPGWNEETEKEYHEFMAIIERHRDELDRATGFGKYAPE